MSKRSTKMLIISLLLGFLILGIGGWAGIHLFQEADEESVSLADAKAGGAIRSVSSDELFVSGSNEEEILGEIHSMHTYLNELLGWGAWQSLEPVEKEVELKNRMKHIREIIVPETTGPLRNDLERAADGIEKALTENRSDELKLTHRIFHDLDVVMNDIVVDRYWGVTATYGSKK